jgi:hypothetical protein
MSRVAVKKGNDDIEKELAGTVGGAAAGRLAGAAIGSIVPGVGTVIGGMLGGALGAKVGDKITDAAGVGGQAPSSTQNSMASSSMATSGSDNTQAGQEDNAEQLSAQQSAAQRAGGAAMAIGQHFAQQQQMQQQNNQQMAEKAKQNSQIQTGEPMDMSWRLLKDIYFNQLYNKPEYAQARQQIIDAAIENMQNVQYSPDTHARIRAGFPGYEPSHTINGRNFYTDELGQDIDARYPEDYMYDQEHSNQKRFPGMVNIPPYHLMDAMKNFVDWENIPLVTEGEKVGQKKDVGIENLFGIGTPYKRQEPYRGVLQERLGGLPSVKTFLGRDMRYKPESTENIHHSYFMHPNLERGQNLLEANIERQKEQKRLAEEAEAEQKRLAEEQRIKDENRKRQQAINRETRKKKKLADEAGLTVEEWEKAEEERIKREKKEEKARIKAEKEQKLQETIAENQRIIQAKIQAKIERNKREENFPNDVNEVPEDVLNTEEGRKIASKWERIGNRVYYNKSPVEDMTDIRNAWNIDWKEKVLAVAVGRKLGYIKKSEPMDLAWQLLKNELQLPLRLGEKIREDVMALDRQHKIMDNPDGTLIQNIHPDMENVVKLLTNMEADKQPVPTRPSRPAYLF